LIDWQVVKIKGIELNKQEELVEELQEVLGELIQVAAKDGLSYRNFLWELVGKYADEETLTKMIADTREHINLRITEPDKFKIYQN
jgi:hypothetical protein